MVASPRYHEKTKGYGKSSVALFYSWEKFTGGIDLRKSIFEPNRLTDYRRIGSFLRVETCDILILCLATTNTHDITEQDFVF